MLQIVRVSPKRTFGTFKTCLDEMIKIRFFACFIPCNSIRRITAFGVRKHSTHFWVVSNSSKQRVTTEMASSIRVVHPSDNDSFLYYENLAVVSTRLRENENEFRVGDPVDHSEQFTFNTNRVYDFTRSAKATIRDYMTPYLLNVLVPGKDAVPEIVEEIGEQLRAAFGFLYNYESYKGLLIRS